MLSLKEIGNSALTTGLEVLQDVAKGENIKTAAKKCLKENSLAFLDNTVSRIAPRKSIKGSKNKQITISSSKPKKRKHQSGELDDTIFSRRFNLSYRYIDDLTSFNNKRFKEFISDIYPRELTISETTESTSVASYLDLLFT